MTSPADAASVSFRIGESAEQPSEGPGSVLGATSPDEPRPPEAEDEAREAGIIPDIPAPPEEGEPWHSALFLSAIVVALLALLASMSTYVRQAFAGSFQRFRRRF